MKTKMFEKIIVATDLSDSAECILSALGGLKPLGTQDVRLIHCIHTQDVGNVIHQMKELAEPVLNRQKKVLEDQGLNVEVQLAIGHALKEIERQAKEEGCGLIVVASHGEHISGDILMGGMCSALVHGASMPLLLMRLPCKGETAETGCETWRNDPLRHILYTTDFSEHSAHAYESCVRGLASSGASELTLMHVQDRARIDPHLEHHLEEFNRIDTERLETLKKELIADGAKNVNIEISYGLPKKEVINRINKGDISLVVMGSQGRGYIGEIFLGSVSHAVARHSVAPVLLIPSE